MNASTSYMKKENIVCHLEKGGKLVRVDVGPVSIARRDKGDELFGVFADRVVSEMVVQCERRYAK